MEFGGVGRGWEGFVVGTGTLLATTPAKESWPESFGMSRAGDAMLPVKAIAMLLDLVVAISMEVALIVSLQIRDRQLVIVLEVDALYRGFGRSRYR